MSWQSVNGNRMYELASELYPICRSITGDGVRETLRILGERIPLVVQETPSGTSVLDWTVPDEWNIRDAYVIAPDGRRVVDFADSNLHVVNYSEPVRASMDLDELRPHLFTHELPDRIPYRTSYYQRDWGFCLAREAYDALEDGMYQVVIESTLGPGSLTYGELLVEGSSEDEVLVTTHVCHPSLANDNLSGIAVLAEIAAIVANGPSRRLSYRFLFIPGTIGSITWLAGNEDAASRIMAGLVIACVGDRATLTYKRSRRGTALVDRAAGHIVSHEGGRTLDFVPWGWDERQFNSPGFDMPVGCLTRSLENEFPEYHSSADDLSVIDAGQLEGTALAVLGIFDILEHDAVYTTLSPKGEPQLGKRGLYRGVGGAAASTEQLALLWVLNQSDGMNGLLDIAERSGLQFAEIKAAADRLRDAGLLG